MSVMTGSLAYRRMRAPREDGAALIEPSLESAGELIRHNAALAASHNVDLQGRSLREVAMDVRRDVVREALEHTRSYRDVNLPEIGDLATTPILVAGHQPQLFHPGVWFKNFGLGRLAERHRAIAVNLVIDSDTMKVATLRVPGGTPQHPIAENVPFDKPAAELPYEQRTVRDRGCLESFGQRAGNIIRPLIANPLLDEFWPLVVQQSRSTDNLGECLARARHCQEAAWGLSTLELPQSRVCKLQGFHQFVCHLLAQLPRLWDTYNAAIAEYRRVNHVRSRVHPVPNLTASEDWLEAPLWLWSDADPRRRRVFVRQRGDQLVLSDRGAVEVLLNLTPEGEAHTAVAQLSELERQGIKLRTRALITTMFARVVLGDLFLHGIGGAKYDEVTDLMIERFFGIEPPKYMTLTATLRLPVAHGDDDTASATAASDRLRQLAFHPERFIKKRIADGQAAALIDTKRRWIETTQTPENAKMRCHSIRGANEALSSFLQSERRELLTQRDSIMGRAGGRAILNSREYAFCLYPEDSLRRLMQQIAND